MGLGDVPLRVVVKQAVPLQLGRIALRTSTTRRRRALATAGLLGWWTAFYTRYRREGIARTAAEFDLLQNTDFDAYRRHYDEDVVTVEEEFAVWGPFHEHRHQMRYDIVADAVRRLLPPGGTVLDIGCGSGLVADRIADLSARYVGMEFGERNARHVAKKFADVTGPLDVHIVRGDAEGLPFPDDSFDVIVLSEVIEHLIRPDLATWELARVLRTGGSLVMTTNNASEMPCRSPLTHLFAWIEKALGATHPRLISLRPWVWPDPVTLERPDRTVAVYLPHTHHIYAQTRVLFEAAGLATTRWSTFEFPPPQSRTDRALERRGRPGRLAVDIVEAVATRTPLLNRLGCHLAMEATKVGPPRTPRPVPGVWPGPLLRRP